MSDKENKRTPNFSAQEETLLMNLISNYSHIIESKKTDSEACKIKKEIWKTLAQEFNSLSGSTHRSSEILLNKYRNLKKKSKKKFSEEKCYSQGTGGGPAKKIILTDTDIKLKEILGTQITGFSSNFDDDTEIRQSQITEDCISIETVEENRINDDHTYTVIGSHHTGHDTILLDERNIDAPISPVVGNEISEIILASTDKTEISSNEEASAQVVSEASRKDWSGKLKTPKSKVLNTSRRIYGTPRSKLVDGVSSWVDTKGHNATLQAKLMMEKHNLYMKNQQEKHELELEIMKKEHELKMDILMKQLDK